MTGVILDAEGGELMAVYVDVLLAINFAVDYLLLKAASIFCGIFPKTLRLAAGAALGAVSSLIIFFAPEHAVTEFGYRIVVSAAVCVAVFCPCGLNMFLKAWFGFTAASFLFSGVVLLWQITVRPIGAISCAGAIYLDIGAPALITCAAAGYAAACLISRILMLKMPKDNFCQVIVINNGASAVFTALIDSGSSIVEPFSNAPVIVCERRSLGQTLPKTLAQGKGLRLVPYKTIDSNGLLSAFLPQKLMIKTADEKTFFAENCYIAVTDIVLGEEYNAICNPRVFSNTKAGDDIYVYKS